MAVTSIMTTEGAIKAKAGANVNTAITDAQYDQWVLQAENFVNGWTRINYSDSFSGLNADVKNLLDDVVSSRVAMLAIMYDMSGYASLAEAESMITVLRDSMMAALSILRDKKTTEFVDNA